MMKTLLLAIMTETRCIRSRRRWRRGICTTYRYQGCLSQTLNQLWRKNLQRLIPIGLSLNLIRTHSALPPMLSGPHEHSITSPPLASRRMRKGRLRPGLIISICRRIMIFKLALGTCSDEALTQTKFGFRVLGAQFPCLVRRSSRPWQARGGGDGSSYSWSCWLWLF